MVKSDNRNTKFEFVCPYKFSEKRWCEILVLLHSYASLTSHSKHVLLKRVTKLVGQLKTYIIIKLVTAEKYSEKFRYSIAATVRGGGEGLA